MSHPYRIKRMKSRYNGKCDAGCGRSILHGTEVTRIKDGSFPWQTFHDNCAPPKPTAARGVGVDEEYPIDYTVALNVLSQFVSTLPKDHPDRRGVVRAVEVLRTTDRV